MPFYSNVSLYHLSNPSKICPSFLWKPVRLVLATRPDCLTIQSWDSSFTVFILPVQPTTYSTSLLGSAYNLNEGFDGRGVFLYLEVHISLMRILTDGDDLKTLPLQIFF